MMRPHITSMLLVAGLTAVSTPAAARQAQTPPQPEAAVKPGIIDLANVDFGLQLTANADDPGRYFRYRDLRSGPLINLFRFDRQRDEWAAGVTAERVGFRDQRYNLSFARFGNVEGSFQFIGVPAYLSRQAATLYAKESPGALRIDDQVQSAVQSGAVTLPSFAGDVTPFDLRTQRNTADVRFRYLPTPAFDLRAGYRWTGRDGAQPFGGSFGFGFTSELPAPIHDHTDEVSSTAEWSGSRGLVRLAYDGSWYRNDAPALVWDNPNRITDENGVGSAQGRMARWPDTTVHTGSVMGAVNLPYRTRADAYVSIGAWLQNEQLLPFTINSAIPPIPLDRPTADAEARVVSTTAGVSSRPHRDWWLTARGRYYDFDNRTPRFAESQFVFVDQNVEASTTGGSSVFAFTRTFLDLDAAYTGVRHLNLRVGYGREHVDRNYRYVEETTENTFRGSVDTAGLPWITGRLLVEHSVRTGTGLDEQVLDDLGEQISLRQFDISDRDRTRVSLIVQGNPLSMLGVTGTVGTGRDNRPNSAFGVQHLDNNFFGIAVDATPREAVSLGVEYGYETFGSLQRSRQANPGPQFNDPTRDWDTDANEHVHTVTGTVALESLAPRTSLNASLNSSWSRQRYLYVLPPNSTLTPPVQLSPVRNNLLELGVGLRHTLTPRHGFAIAYWFDHYDVDDFALGPATVQPLIFPTIALVGYMWKPYDVHGVSARYIYQW